jgi:hypothetical protein
MNDVFAAPASGLPSLPTALLSQVSCAIAVPAAKAAITVTRITRLNIFLSLPPLNIAIERRFGIQAAAAGFDSKFPARSRAGSQCGADGPPGASLAIEKIRKYCTDQVEARVTKTRQLTFAPALLPCT